MTFQPTLKLRVMKRAAFNSDQLGHTIYVLQQLFQGVEDQQVTEWRDVPVVDEKCNEAKYE